MTDERKHAILFAATLRKIIDAVQCFSFPGGPRPRGRKRVSKEIRTLIFRFTENFSSWVSISRKGVALVHDP